MLLSLSPLVSVGLSLPSMDGPARSRVSPSMMAATIAPPASTADDAEAQRAAFDKVVMGTYGRFKLNVARGQGCYLYDSDGAQYLDFAAGISTCCLGHGDTALADAVYKQMRTVHHVSNLYYIPQQGELARRLVASSCADKAFFCNSGAEANEAAIKLARKHATQVLGIKKPVILTMTNSFHGRTMATITATGQPKYQKGFAQLLPGFDYVTYNDVEDLRAAVRRTRGLFGFGKSRLAAIMLEPLQGEGGITPATAEFIGEARKLCDETGALLICDEVQTGMGRSGAMWGYMQHGVEPDVFTTAKALGGGVPIGAMLCKARADVFQPGDHASTFGGNPLASAAGNAVLDAYDERGVLENVRQRSAQLKAGLQEIADSTGAITEVRGWGLILGMQLSDGCGFTAAQLCAACLEGGLLTVPAGTTVLRLVPPLVVSEAEASEALTKLRDAIAACSAKHAQS